MMTNSLSLIAFTLLFWSCSGSANFFSSKIYYIKSDDISLAAKIYKPNGEGPFPAVVLVHGSKNQTMDYYTEYSKYFVKHGIVAVNYDKRGHGRSSGDLWTSTFTDLAKDAVAIVEHLQTLPYVDPQKVGLWADSQGGWIILIADSLSSEISFLINKAGPVCTPLEQTLYDYEQNYMRPGSTPGEVITELKVWYKDVFIFLTRDRNDSLWKKIKYVIDKYENTDYLKAGFDQYYLSILGVDDKIKPKDKVVLDPSGRDFDFDPIPYLQRLETPMLYQIGTLDHLNNVQACIDKIIEINNKDITLKVYEGADHGIQIQRKPTILFKPNFPDGYLESLVNFIEGESVY